MGAKYSREQFAARLEANGDPKLNAAADFAARLLNGPAGEAVARIVLFGSVARGEARPESDVDVLVIGTDSLASLSRALAHASAEAVIDSGELVAPIGYGATHLFLPTSYFVWAALDEGREIYAMKEVTLRRRAAAGLLRKARRLLRQSEDSFARDSYELAIDGGYTAAEHAAKGAIMLKPGVKLPTTHGGVAQVFGREYVRTGEAPAEWSDLLQQKLELRSRAMYDYQSEPVEEEVRHTLDFAGQMVGFLQKQLDALPPEDDLSPETSGDAEP